MGSLDERIKDNYEHRQRHYLARRTPVIVRVDGRAFHTFTKACKKPFDLDIIYSMISAAEYLASEMQGFKAGYVQSDEASFLLTDYDQLQTEAWFNYNQSKVESISASAMTCQFNQAYWHGTGYAQFDARAFNVPREEVVNYFLWRAKDWERNSVSMYCSHFYSQKEMHGQGRADQHEMLNAKGKNWTTDLPDYIRNGTFIFGGDNRRFDVLPTYEAISAVIEPLVNCDKTNKQDLAANVGSIH